jgi:LCP family protein required for cell wall assembly
MANPFGKRPPIKDAQHYPNLFRSVRTRRNRFWGRWYSWVAIGLAVVVLGGAGWGYWYYNALEDVGDQPVAGTNPPPAAEDPKSVLLVGSDSRAGLTEEEQLDLGAAAVGGERADTLIVAHVDPNTDRVMMVQFPRDYYVTYPDGHQDRINAALQKGPGYMVKTVEHVTGLDINDYVQVNIAGFRDLVDAIGGVEICLTEPIPFSPATGIEVTEEEVPGMVEFDGDRAIRFVRERKAFAEGDFARVQNQQRFLAAAINKVLSLETLLRPDRLLKIKGIVGENVIWSETLGIPQIRRLANQLSNVDPDTYEVYAAPNLGTATINGASVVEPDLPALEYLFDQIAQNRSPSDDGVPDIPPSEIAVGVYNGTGVDGAASEAAEELEAATADDEGEIDLVEVADADSDDYGKSRIVYEKANEEKARFIAAALPKARLEVGKTGKNVDVEVIVGEAFDAKRIVQVTPLDIPEPGEVPPECA